MGHANARSHLWKFSTWSFVCRALTLLYMGTHRHSEKRTYLGRGRASLWIQSCLILKAKVLTTAWTWVFQWEREMHSPWEDQGDFLKKVVDLALEEVGFRYGAGKRVFQILRISGPGEGAWEARGSVRRFQDGVKGIMERLKVGKLKLLR